MKYFIFRYSKLQKQSFNIILFSDRQLFILDIVTSAINPVSIILFSIWKDEANYQVVEVLPI